MKSMIDTLKTSVLAFANDEEGTAMIEYGLIGALVSASCVTALGALGTSIDGVLSYLSGILDTAAGVAPVDPPAVP